ncbi:GntR family transcriptional regulator [Halopolyspora algeriensis]|uniref:GntR family transcriptional regulator n=1 Tax=Halopolyspora algeriensis TaxID=1500506 RepID=A0A368W080_9ACTN|nr:GntR family transcriptional regulator [Halopolyspora algeriensis]RCW45991.1 GntR family transcriptional regulator [Halopolyspora algeriensis]TQM55404.1 GntR family transcriptional regulator [Halopolyspora algeriensis]
MAKLGRAALPRVSAAEQVYRVLREKIEDGSLAPGEHLADGELAEELGVSRTPVREALRRLVDQGAVETVPGRYTRVAALDETEGAKVFPLHALLYGFATESALETLDNTDLTEMTAYNERMRIAVGEGDLEAAREADRQWHGVVLRRVDNPYLSLLLDTLSLHSRRLEALYFQDSRRARDSYRQHADIIAALRQGDRAAACALVRANTGQGPCPR